LRLEDLSGKCAVLVSIKNLTWRIFFSDIRKLNIDIAHCNAASFATRFAIANFRADTTLVAAELPPPPRLRATVHRKLMLLFDNQLQRELIKAKKKGAISTQRGKGQVV